MMDFLNDFRSKTGLITQVLSSLTVACAVMFSGCGSEGPQPKNALPTFPITGKVTVNGSVPDESKIIVINATPESDSADGGPKVSPGGFASPKDGTFTLSTYRKGDGVPAGTYKLTFRLGVMNMMAGKVTGDDFNGKYDDPETSEYSVTVTGNESDPIDAGHIDLEL